MSEIHLVILRNDCGLCGQTAVLAAVTPTQDQFLCRKCAVAEYGREWIDAAFVVFERTYGKT